jgi:hypothetical protein
MIARDAALLMHEHHHGGSAIPANQIDGKIRTAGSFRAMYRQYRRAHTLPFFALAASRPPADQDQLRAENARLRTSLTTVLTSTKIRSRRRSKRPDRGARIALWRSPTRVVAVFPLSGVPTRGTPGVLEYPFGGTGVLSHRVQHILMPPKKGPFFAYIFYCIFRRGLWC